jgi:hypothetical protein
LPIADVGRVVVIALVAIAAAAPTSVAQPAAPPASAPAAVDQRYEPPGGFPAEPPPEVELLWPRDEIVGAVEPHLRREQTMSFVLAGADFTALHERCPQADLRARLTCLYEPDVQADIDRRLRRAVVDAALLRFDVDGWPLAAQRRFWIAGTVAVLGLLVLPLAYAQGVRALASGPLAPDRVAPGAADLLVVPVGALVALPLLGWALRGGRSLRFLGRWPAVAAAPTSPSADPGPG